jgi:hypothetical protein
MLQGFDSTLNICLRFISPVLPGGGGIRTKMTAARRHSGNTKSLQGVEETRYKLLKDKIETSPSEG